MPWLETAPVDERLQFVHDALSDRFTISELCARYGVSRRVGYKWLAREETDDGVWSIYLNSVLLATLDEREYFIRG